MTLCICVDIIYLLYRILSLRNQVAILCNIHYMITLDILYANGINVLSLSTTFVSIQTFFVNLV